MTEQQFRSNELGTLVGSVWSEAKVRESLGVTAEALAERQEAGEILGLVTSDGATFYPVWQFQRYDGRVEVKPTLVPVFQTLRSFDGWAVAVLLLYPPNLMA